MTSRSRWQAVTVLGVALSLCGCSVFQQRDRMAQFNSAYSQGQYARAAGAMQFDAAKGQSGGGRHVLELLHQGEAYRLEGDFKDAIDAFDRAEDGMKYLDTEGFASAASENVMSVLVNESTRDYRALMSEAILVNTYKGLSFLALGNTADARVEFNRADDRTRRAVDFFSEEIAEQKRALRNDPANARMVQQSIDSGSMRSVLSSHYGDPGGWSVYPDYIVPASTYLHGLYFLATGQGSSDIERAATSLQRVAQMAPGNATLKADATLAQALAAGKRSRADLPPQVWVMYENGLGPVLEEVRFDVPLFYSHRGNASMILTGIALPRYRDRASVAGHVQASTPTIQAATDDFASMGKVIRTEMQARFPSILTRAISAAVVKGAMQYQATESFGIAGQLGSIIYSLATTQADLRGWQAMPNHWEVTRLERPADGEVELSDSVRGRLGTLDVPDQPFTLIYVKRPTAAGPATVMLLDLQGRRPGQCLVLAGGGADPRSCGGT
ncbi:COG3014 family protein [Marinobacter sp. JSM 1782161]|uniref:COG3014 family protein n=1 Tax=Marinobacter sp. JSM 1782161 TaxID=2685906 RepID=UPI001402C813|nr:hypothetical protein [Marinobacter sp. JSM 1782161]